MIWGREGSGGGWVGVGVWGCVCVCVLWYCSPFTTSLCSLLWIIHQRHISLIHIAVGSPVSPLLALPSLIMFYVLSWLNISGLVFHCQQCIWSVHGHSTLVFKRLHPAGHFRLRWWNQVTCSQWTSHTHPSSPPSFLSPLSPVTG